MVLGAIGRSFGAYVVFSSGPPRCPWRLPRCTWGLWGPSKVLLGAYWDLTWTFLNDFEFPNRLSELLRRPSTSPRVYWRRFGIPPGSLRCDFEVLKKEPPSFKHIQTRYSSLVFSSHWSLAARHSSLLTSLLSLVTSRSPLVTRHSPLVTRHSSRFTRHSSLDTRHSSLVTIH